jgi:hypothetical protein
VLGRDGDGDGELGSGSGRVSNRHGHGALTVAAQALQERGLHNAKGWRGGGPRVDGYLGFWRVLLLEWIGGATWRAVALVCFPVLIRDAILEPSLRPNAASCSRALHFSHVASKVGGSCLYNQHVPSPTPIYLCMVFILSELKSVFLDES